MANIFSTVVQNQFLSRVEADFTFMLICHFSHFTEESVHKNTSYLIVSYERVCKHIIVTFTALGNQNCVYKVKQLHIFHNSFWLCLFAY